MREVHVNMYINAPIERVFEAISDHESFIKSSDTHTSIARPGAPERNGLGCVRAVRSKGGVRFTEEVTGWSPPASYEYQIRDTSLPLRHHGGQVRLTKRGEGTEVDWTTRFEVTVPLVGRALEPLTAGILTTTFTEMLIAAKARLEDAS